MAIHNFAQVPNVRTERSVMDRTTHHKTTFNESYLIPILVDEILPGDTMSLRETIFARLLTLASPIMDNLYLQTFYFWVPLRIVWDHCREFFGEQRSYASMTAQTEYTLPQIDTGSNGAGQVAEGDLADYFGLPKGYQSGGVTPKNYLQAAPFRAYNKIYNRFFRDQNLVDPAHEETGDGCDQMEDYPVRKVSKFHDYFTSCLPWPQKGDPVQLSLGEEAPVIGNGYALGFTEGHDNLGLVSASAASTLQAYIEAAEQPVGTDASGYSGIAASKHVLEVSEDPDVSGLICDLSSAVAATVNDLRLSIALQRMMEKDARYGTRYKEYLQGHYGVDFNDSVYEPEYLGGNRRRISINPVTKTYEDAGEMQVGDLRAMATVSQSGHGFTKSFTEHGFVIGLCCVRGDLTYFQGARKMWTRLTKEDIYDPCLAHIGEQPVYKRELHVVGTSQDAEIFGYQEPWAEYRYFPALLTGLMRPNATGGLSTWTIAEQLGSNPELNQAFIEDNTPLARVVTVTDQDHVKADFRFDIKHARPMPLYSVPGLMDHF